MRVAFLSFAKGFLLFFFSLYHFFTVVGRSVPQDTAGQQDRRCRAYPAAKREAQQGDMGEEERQEGEQRQLDPGPYFYARFQRVLLGISCWQEQRQAEARGHRQEGGHRQDGTGKRAEGGGGRSHAGRQGAATCMRT